MNRQLIVYAALGAMCLILVSCASTGGDSASGERFRGRLAAMSGPGGGNTAYLDVHIDRVASDAEVEALAQTLASGGEKALFDAVADTEPMGWVRLGQNTRYQLRVIRSIETPEGRIVRAITDRPIQFMEIIRPLRSRDYAFGIIELQLDEKGEGSGAVVAAARIAFKDNTIEIESFGNQPYRVLSVKPVSL